jgi:4-hydroxythreonine-4-phosphate dehydrogenase
MTLAPPQTPRGASPRIAVTVGDPSGIGPEIAVKASQDPRVTAVCRPIIYGPHSAEDLAPYACGIVDPLSGQRAYEESVRAVQDASVGRVQAIATAPINKAAFAVAE